MQELFLNDEQIFELIERYGSPLYVYDENILRERCREMKNLVTEFNFEVSYSIKANTNSEILKIVKGEGINADAFSRGEMFVLRNSGYKSDEIYYVSNNASISDFQYAIDNKISISCDAVSQIETYGKLNPGGEVSIRINPGRGFGHSEKVVTAGEKTKFGIAEEFIPEALEIIKKYNLKLIGINQHLGSLFLNYKEYVEGAKAILEIAKQFPGLRFIDLGGGFGVPYKPGENRLDMQTLSRELQDVLREFIAGYDNKDVLFRSEPGRYLVAECGVLLGTVNCVKQNYKNKYIGTDIGFNVLIRPVMYGSHHEVYIAKRNKNASEEKEIVSIVGDICESGDIVAKDRLLPVIDEGDIVLVQTAGAYGFSMSSNYNSRLRPAEVLIKPNGQDVLIRRRDKLEDLIKNTSL